MIKNKTKGFTLIELLVVVAIIGLLSAIVLISVKSARDKAEEKKNMQFSASIYHSLGAYAIGIWHFDGNLSDSSGNGNNADTSWDQNYSPGIINQAFDFNDTEQIYIDDSPKLDNKSGAITMEFWAKAPNYFMGNLINSENYYGAWNYPYSCYLYEFLDLECYFQDENGSYAEFIAITPNNKWFHVVFTYDGKGGEPEFYLNNKIIEPGTNDLTGRFTNRGYFYIGESYSSLLMDELRIYDSYIAISEVQKHYVQGLMRIGLAEYRNKNHSLNSFSL